MSDETATIATILVVDDNPAGRYATSRVLRAAHFKVLEAATARGRSSQQGADLIVLDVNLPDISGFEVCRQLRAVFGHSTDPVMHLSATFVQDADKVQGLMPARRLPDPPGGAAGSRRDGERFPPARATPKRKYDERSQV